MNIKGLQEKIIKQLNKHDEISYCQIQINSVEIKLLNVNHSGLNLSNWTDLDLLDKDDYKNAFLMHINLKEKFVLKVVKKLNKIKKFYDRQECDFKYLYESNIETVDYFVGK